jgi:hypothetical protein
MKTYLLVLATLLLAACNNSKKGNETETKDNTINSKTEPPNTVTDNGTAKPTQSVSINIEGKENTMSGSVLVAKDKEKLKAGYDYMAMITGSDNSNHESLTLNFIFALKPGQYPVVGSSFLRGEGEKAEVYGGLLGGKPKITEYTVNLTDIKDLGSNNLGGHKWSISGTFDRIVIPAMAIMTMDASKHHPKEVVIEKGSFSNLMFDDNWEDIMNKAFDKMHKD